MMHFYNEQEPTMLTKRFLSISLLLPLVALSAAEAASRDAFAYSPPAADENGSGWNYRYPGSPRPQVTHPGGR
jgi:hypothetical protein